MLTHTGEDPEINQIQTQNQAKQDDWPKKTLKKCPIKVIQTTTRARLSLWAHPVCRFTGALFPLINTLLVSLLSISLWKFISTQLATSCHGLATRIQCSHSHSLTLNSGWGTEILFQAAAGRGHPRSQRHPVCKWSNLDSNKSVSLIVL